MKITQHTDVEAFWAQVEPLLRADPLRNTIALTVLRGLVAAPDPDADPPLLITITDTLPAGTPPAGTPPAGTPPAGTPPAGTADGDTQPAGTRPLGTRFTGTTPTDSVGKDVGGGTQPTDTRPVDTRLANALATDPAGRDVAATDSADADSADADSAGRGSVGGDIRSANAPATGIPALVGAAFCTPPWPVGVSAVPDEAMPEFVAFLRDIAFPVTGVSAPLDKAELFADIWLATAGGTKERTVALRLYLLGDLIAPAVPGEARLATEDDVALLARWREAFAAEIPHDNASGRDQTVPVRRSLAAGNGNLIWHVGGEPVSHAAASKPIGGMSRIGPVYTPAEHRNHGYASAVTAAAAQWALDAGADKVTLFTDLANPTSNAIYQKIGFRPHHDAVEYRFTAPA